MNGIFSKKFLEHKAIVKKIAALVIIAASMPFVNACTKVSIDYTNLLEYLWLTRPRISVTGITLNKERTTMLVSGTEQLTALILPLTATDQAVTWTSSDAAVVAVTTGGRLNGVAAGSATVTATSADRGFTASCSVTVSSVAVPVASIVTNKKSTTILAGSAEQLMATILPLAATNQNVTWASSNPWIVTVGPGGLVSAVAAGSAVITVTSNDGVYSASFTVTVATVAVAAAGVTMNKASLTLGAGSFEQLYATISPSNATNQNLTWTSSNPAVATVGTGGLVTAVAAGTTVITARTADGGFTATCTVTVTGSAAAQWARTDIAGPNQSYFYNVAAAPDGSSCAVGYIVGTGPFNFGNGVTASPDYALTNLLLVKYDSSGNALWAKTVTGGGNISYYSGVAVAPDGSVYAVGEIDNTGTFNLEDGITASAPAGVNAILVKYSSTGVTQWAQKVTSSLIRSTFFRSVSVGPDGSVYVTGTIYDNDPSYDFGNGVLVAGGYVTCDSIVLVKYNSSGLAQWAVTELSGSGNSLFYDISVAPDGSVYAAGSINANGTYDFGNGATTAGSCTFDNNIVLVKYDNSGLAQWAKSVSTLGDHLSYFQDVSTAPDGSVYAAGIINGADTFDFGNSQTATVTYAGYNAVLVKYDSAGVTQWAQTVPAGSGGSEFRSVSTAADGFTYAGGYISGTTAYDFGGVTATGVYAGGMSSVLVKYNSTGVPQWAKSLISGNNNSFFYGVSVAPDGSVYAGGTFYDTVFYDFGNGATVTGIYGGDNCLMVQYK